MIGDIGISAALLSEVVALNYDAVDTTKLPVVGVFVLTLQLSLKYMRDYGRKPVSQWLAYSVSLIFVNLYMGLSLVSQADAPFSMLAMLGLIYALAVADSVPPIQFHFNGLGVISYFLLQVAVVMLCTEALCSYVSFTTVLEFIPTYLMYQSYELAKEVTMMDSDCLLNLNTLAIVLGRFDSLRFAIVISCFAYTYTFIDFLFKSYWRGLVVVLLPLLLKNTHLFVNFKLDRMPTAYLRFFWLFSAVSVASFKLSLN